MSNPFLCIATAVAIVAGLPSETFAAQAAADEITAEVLRRDSLFWAAYNTCATDRIDEFISADVEFYHDKGGITLGIPSLKASLQQNICGGQSKLRRHVVSGTERVFPLEVNDAVYGAILSGEHLFFITEPGQAERLSGRARFTHLWLKEEGVFKMARILSYDHQPAGAEPASPAVTLSPTQLERFTGRYRGPISGTTTVSREGDLLVVQGDKMRLVLHASTEDTFVVQDRALTFQFQLQAGRAWKMVVRERGTIAEEALAEP